jgi:hypothetical protein
MTLRADSRSVTVRGPAEERVLVNLHPRGNSINFKQEGPLTHKPDGVDL